jgi:hydroxymethylpyrimidine pyrophosphatase-like HAD family hydrolase
MPFVIAVDYDDTLFAGTFGKDGPPNREVIEKVKEFKKQGAEVVLWTCREGSTLKNALRRCKLEGLEFDAVNSNSPSEVKYQEDMFNKHGHRFALRKIYADLYVDDKAPGSIDYFLACDVRVLCKAFEDR